MDCTIVIPTIGRPSLQTLLSSLEDAQDARAIPIVIVDDRKAPAESIDATVHSPAIASRMRIVRSGGVGPAGARNLGWRAASSTWIAFLDDDVVVTAAWWRDLEHDLANADAKTGGIQATIDVPLPLERAASDWERNVAALAQSEWITADMVYRREALADAGGFDARFRRAYREDSDLALRVQQRGWTLRRGARRTTHPVRPADAWISVRLQRGNADDALMRALHGPRWRIRARAPHGRFGQHAVTVACAGIAVCAALRARRDIALWGTLGWLALTGLFAWSRIAPGPRTHDEVAAMIVTSVAIPFAAVYYKALGTLMASGRAHRGRPA